jgi:hypothetical protein
MSNIIKENHVALPVISYFEELAVGNCLENKLDEEEDIG